MRYPVGMFERHRDLDAFAGRDARDALAHFLRHAGRSGEPGRFRKILADHVLEAALDARERRRVHIDDLAVGGEQPLVHVGRLEHGADVLFALLQGGGALGHLPREFFAEAPLAVAHLCLRADALDMSPRPFGHFGDQRQLVVGPEMRTFVMDRHQRGEPAFLDQRHADGRADADALERRGLLRRQLLQVVVDHQRPAGAEILDRELAEIRQAVVADDVHRARRRPVAADREAVLVRIHVGIGATGDAEMLADHARGDGEDRVGIGALGGFLAERVEELQPRLVLAQAPRRMHRLRGLDHDRDHADRLSALAEHRRIIEIHPDLLGHAGARERQVLIAIGERAAGEADLHDVVVEVGDLRPAFAHRRAEQPRMPPAGEDRIGIVVDHRALLAPQRDDRDRRAQHQADGRLDRCRPAFDRAERRLRPVEGGNDVCKLAAPGQERQFGIGRRHGSAAPTGPSMQQAEANIVPFTANPA